MLKSESGFTLIEYILALAIFSLMLLIIVGGFLNIVHLHQTGLAQRNTQQYSRSGMEEMVRSSRSALAPKTTGNGVCLFYDDPVHGPRLYYYQNGTGNLMRGTIAPNDPNPNCVTSAADRVVNAPDVQIARLIIKI